MLVYIHPCKTIQINEMIHIRSLLLFSLCNFLRNQTNTLQFNIVKQI